MNAMAKRHTEAMTGSQFTRARKAFGLSQSKMAELLGVGLRTVIRMEATASRKSDIPLSYAKLIRCLARERGIEI